MKRAGRRKNGTSASEATVSCHDSDAIAAMMSTRETALLTTLLRTDVKACWAPITSLPSRVTRAPVWARVKKAMGWRRTWPKTSVRRS